MTPSTYTNVSIAGGVLEPRSVRRVMQIYGEVSKVTTTLTPTSTPLYVASSRTGITSTAPAAPWMDDARSVTLAMPAGFDTRLAKVKVNLASAALLGGGLLANSVWSVERKLIDSSRLIF